MRAAGTSELISHLGLGQLVKVCKTSKAALGAPGHVADEKAFC